MNILNYIEQHPQEALRLIGLSYEQFKDVVIQAELQHQHQLTEQEKTKIRLNNQGGGRQKHLSVTEEILLTLIYLRHSRSVSAGWSTIWGKRVKSPYDVPLLDSHSQTAVASQSTRTSRKVLK